MVVGVVGVVVGVQRSTEAGATLDGRGYPPSMPSRWKEQVMGVVV